MFPQLQIDNEKYLVFESDFSENRTRQILSDRKVPFKVVEGKYKSITNPAYIVNIMSALKIVDLIENQDTVMELSPVNHKGTREATLVRKDFTEAHMGDFKPVSKEYAMAKESYTYDPTTNQYFVAE